MKGAPTREAPVWLQLFVHEPTLGVSMLFQLPLSVSPPVAAVCE